MSKPARKGEEALSGLSELFDSAATRFGAAVKVSCPNPADRLDIGYWIYHSQHSLWMQMTKFVCTRAPGEVMFDSSLNGEKRIWASCHLLGMVD